MPPDCIGQRYVLQHDSTSGVYSTVKYAAKYGDSVFLHRVEWQDAPCMPGCTFTYTVSSSNGLPGGVEQESASTVGAMPKLCTVKIGGI